VDRDERIRAGSRIHLATHRPLQGRDASWRNASTLRTSGCAGSWYRMDLYPTPPGERTLSLLLDGKGGWCSRRWLGSRGKCHTRPTRASGWFLALAPPPACLQRSAVDIRLDQLPDTLPRLWIATAHQPVQLIGGPPGSSATRVPMIPAAGCLPSPSAETLECAGIGSVRHQQHSASSVHPWVPPTALEDLGGVASIPVAK